MTHSIVVFPGINNDRDKLTKPIYVKEPVQIMKRKQTDVLYLVLSLVIITGLFKGIVESTKKITPDIVRAVSPRVEAIAEIKPTEKVDYRIERLNHYLQSKNSPLAEYAKTIVEEADRNGIDWTLVTSISGKESSFGKRIPEGSHNAWGIGGAKSVRHFSSWNESIKFTSELLGKNYRRNMNKGLQTKYCPSVECSSSWVDDVTGFSEGILAESKN